MISTIHTGDVCVCEGSDMTMLCRPCRSLATKPTMGMKRQCACGKDAIPLSKRTGAVIQSPRHPYGVRPLGNLLLQDPEGHGNSIRTTGLGTLHVLSDEIFIEILSNLDARSLFRAQAISKAFFVFSRYGDLWKTACIRENGGRLMTWAGDWRSSWLAEKRRACHKSPPAPLPLRLDSTSLYSDVLYQPFHAATSSLDQYFLAAGNIERVSATTVTLQDFRARHHDRPLIITDAMNSWPSYTDRLWTLDSLRDRLPDRIWQAEAVQCDLETYISYSRSQTVCNAHETHIPDEQPLYLFDARFADSGGLGDDYRVPTFFDEDLFKLLGTERPDFRWIIAGPARSGSTFHKDPNGTSAWNAVVRGRKRWIMFPPNVVPPGVYVNYNMSEVTSPVSLPEWFHSFYHEARRRYGPNARDPRSRNVMREGTCHAGEIVHVPSGWWHLVVNVEESIAVTQNYAAKHNLGQILFFLKHKADQISGFRELSEESQIYQRFLDALARHRPDCLDSGLRDLASLEALASTPTGGSRKKGWEKLQEVDEHGGFSFTFFKE